MNNLIYVGSFSRLLRSTFGDKIQEGFISKNLPFIIYDYDEMKRKCSGICEKLDYEYIDNVLVYTFMQKWKKMLHDYNQTYLDNYWRNQKVDI